MYVKLHLTFFLINIRLKIFCTLLNLCNVYHQDVGDYFSPHLICFVAVNIMCSLLYLPTPALFHRLHMFLIQYFCLLLMPAVYPLSATFSKPTFLIKDTKYVKYLLPILSKFVPFDSTLLKTYLSHVIPKLFPTSF